MELIFKNKNFEVLNAEYWSIEKATADGFKQKSSDLPVSVQVRL